MAYNFITAEEAAEMIENGTTIGLSGFTAPGNPKAVLEAVAHKAEREHNEGREFKVNIFTGASTNDHVDGILSRNNAINMRAPYQNTPDLRKRINSHDAHYFDRHLSEMAQETRYGFYGNTDVAVIEAAAISEDGEVLLGCGLGNIPTYAPRAKRIFIELNEALPQSLLGMHDIYLPLDPPHRREIPIYAPNDRIGRPTLKIDPSKVVGIVRTNSLDGVKSFTKPDAVSEKIGANVVRFLVSEYQKGRIPKEFLPLQSGVGNVANAVLNYLCMDKELPNFFHDKILMRPAEISNNPEVIRRLGVIAMNTALEADIFGCVNSTHVLGTRMMNGIGGSGDFTRNAYISIFSCPSVTKEGLISNIVPMVSHADHSEHSVDILITDQGIADLRAKDPQQRAHEIIENCAHPDYRPILRDYLRLSKGGQTPATLNAAFAFHTEFANSGDMRNVDFSKFA